MFYRFTHVLCVKHKNHLRKIVFINGRSKLKDQRKKFELHLSDLNELRFNLIYKKNETIKVYSVSCRHPCLNDGSSR